MALASSSSTSRIVLFNFIFLVVWAMVLTSLQLHAAAATTAACLLAWHRQEWACPASAVERLPGGARALLTRGSYAAVGSMAPQQPRPAAIFIGAGAAAQFEGTSLY